MRLFTEMKRLLLVLFLISLTAIEALAQDDIRFGSVAMDTPAIMYERLQPLTQYLSQQIQQPVTLKLSPNMSDAIDQLSGGNVDLAYLTPVAYLNAHEKGQVQLVVKTVTKGRGSFRLMIVVHEDSEITQPEELNGGSFAFGDKKALLQRAVVLGAGLKVEDFSEHRFIGHYDNIARAVLAGDFDAGILKDTTAFKWQGKGLRIIYQSPELPPYNVSAASHIDSETLYQLRQAFLNLSTENPEHQKIIKALDKKYDGFAASSDEEYEIVRTLIKPFRN